MHSVPPVERRGSGRPSNGDTAPCPRCGIGTIEFNERYRIVYADQRKAVPAWVCDMKACGYFQLARRRDRVALVRRLGPGGSGTVSSRGPEQFRPSGSRPPHRKKPH